MEHDLSMWGLFIRADIIVKAVMLGLFAASIWCWAIVFEKVFRLRRAQGAADAFEDTFWSGGSLEELFDRIGANPPDPMSSIFAAAMREWRRSTQGQANPAAFKAGLQQRVDRVMGVTLQREMERLEKQLGVLASIGSVAPFVGLFGTVWGIMNSFVAIANEKNTSLAVVAPGIAEALFATAIGLVAAIPAVVAYNKLANDFARYAARLENFAAEFSAILSRQLDARGQA